MISIAIATFNGEKFLREQLDSIMSQTVTDWELIICDDCSEDATMQILKEYAGNDSRISVFENEKNLGFKKNFEKAISLCSGDYIALSDQDDIWMENHLEVLLENIAGKSAAAGNAVMIDSAGAEKKYSLSEGDRYYAAGNNIDKLFTILCYRNPFSGAISMYSTRKCLDVALPIPDFVKYHDLWFSLVACCLDGLEYTFEPLVKHRVHGKNESGEHHISLCKQLSSIGAKEKRREFSMQSIKMCEELVTRIPDMESQRREAIAFIKRYHENKLGKHRISTIVSTAKHYKQIYSTQSYRGLFARCAGFLIQKL